MDENSVFECVRDLYIECMSGNKMRMQMTRGMLYFTTNAPRYTRDKYKNMCNNVWKGQLIFVYNGHSKKFYTTVYIYNSLCGSLSYASTINAIEMVISTFLSGVWFLNGVLYSYRRRTIVIIFERILYCIIAVE